MPIVRAASIILAVLGLIALPLQAAGAKEQPTSPLVGALQACRAIADPAQRLACYDKEAGALVEATQKGDVSVVDRAQMKQARKSLFGFGVPKLPFFSGDKSAEDDTGEIESTIVSSRGIGYGKFQIRIEEGNALWETTTTYMALKAPQRGQKIKIKRGIMGSYTININGQRGVQARRIG